MTANNSSWKLHNCQNINIRLWTLNISWAVQQSTEAVQLSLWTLNILWMVDTGTNTLNIKHFVNGTNAVWIREELLEVAELWKRQQYFRKVKTVFAQKYNYHCELWTFLEKSLLCIICVVHTNNLVCIISVSFIQTICCALSVSFCSGSNAVCVWGDYRVAHELVCFGELHSVNCTHCCTSLLIIVHTVAHIVTHIVAQIVANCCTYCSSWACLLCELHPFWTLHRTHCSSWLFSIFDPCRLQILCFTIKDYYIDQV